jgi:hypothetical protein
MGGTTAWSALEEMRLCYIEGYYLACVLLAQSFIEQSLANLYIIYGEEKVAEQGFKKLIDKALADHQVAPEVATRLHELRQIRNSYVHLNAGLSSRTFIGRLADKQRKTSKEVWPNDLTKEDAETAIQIVVDFLHDNELRNSNQSAEAADSDSEPKSNE